MIFPVQFMQGKKSRKVMVMKNIPFFSLYYTKLKGSVAHYILDFCMKV